MSDGRFQTTGRIERDEDLDLAACEADPVHLGAAIQPHGTFLQLDPDTRTVRSAAENTGEYLGLEAEEAVGGRLEEVVDAELVRSIAEPFDAAADRPPRFIVDQKGRTLVGSIFEVDSGIGLEFDAAVGERGNRVELLTDLRSHVDGLRESASLQEVRERTVRAVRALSGLDRVMFYEFNEHEHGTVLAEERPEGARSYLGHRFPASDIPEPARRLYRKKLLRYIRDVTAGPVPIVGADGPRGRRELDLTHSALRAVPPVHLEYLSNMGVGGSMSVSILVEGELWGMVACHSRGAAEVGWSRRQLCRQIGQFSAERISKLLDRRRRDRVERFERGDSGGATPENYEELLDRVESRRVQWLSALDADAAHVCLADRRLWLADDRTAQVGRELLDDVESRLEDQRLVSSDSIVDDVDPGWAHSDRIAGFLAIRVGSSPSSYAVWFRSEERREVEWAGDPRAPATSSGSGGIDPRRSFETYIQEIAGRCELWSSDDCEVARACRAELTRSTLEAQSAYLRELNEQLEAINDRNRRLVERLDRVARTDDLTGLPNRGELDRRLRDEIERFDRYQGELAFALLDLDRFKRINDEHGHRVGDEVLGRVGALLRGETREPDVPARYGGEEFAVLLPRTSQPEAVDLSERILEKLRREEFETEAGSVSVTASVGVSSFRGSDDDADSLIRRADRAMYRAKDEGRDRVEVEEP